MAVPPTITERYPPLPLDQVSHLVRAFPTASNDEQEAALHTLISAHPMLSYNWGRDWRYRRARIVDEGWLPDNASELIWRSDVPAKLGRVNPAGFDVLYIADRRDTALSEIRVVDSPVIIAEFQIRTGKSVRLLPIGEMVQIQRTGRGLSGEASKLISDALNACDVEQSQSMLIADAFLLECLTNRADDYALSSKVAKALFDRSPATDAIAYPSRRQMGATSFAVRADRVWNAWHISSVRAGRAEHLGVGFYRLHSVKHVTDIHTDGRLQWDEAIDLEPNSVAMLGSPYSPLT